MEITSGIIGGARRVVLYGPEGIGKTSFAACLPDPVFIDTEGSTVRYNVRRLPAPESWPMLLGEVEWCIQNPEALRTLAIDTADWAERLCIQNILTANKVRSIEDFGYGKGYVMVQEEFGRLLNLLTDLTRKGVHVILTAHAYMRKFEQPDEFGAYDRWELKLSKKVAPMVKEWSDMLLFANYETYVVRDDKTKTAKAQGGRRVMFTTHNPCWDAKNRENFPDKMDFDYYQIARCFETIEPDQTHTDTLEGNAALTEMGSVHGNTSEGLSKPLTEKTEDSSSKVPERAKQAPAARNSAMPEDGDVVKPTVAQPGAGGTAPVTGAANPAAPSTPAQGSAAPASPAPTATGTGRSAADANGIPPALLQLMQQDGVRADEIQYAVAAKGYFPNDMPISAYPADFVQGVLIGAWPQVRAMVKQNREDCPF